MVERERKRLRVEGKESGCKRSGEWNRVRIEEEGRKKEWRVGVRGVV